MIQPMRSGKWIPAMALALLTGFSVEAQKPKDPPKEKNASTTAATTPPAVPAKPQTGPKPYKDIVTDKAVTDDGLITVHKVDDKYYFEIPKSLLGREVLVVNRLSKAAAGMRNSFVGYAGDKIGDKVISFEKGPGHKLFVRLISYDERAGDTTASMYRAVANSNLQPIAQAFDIASYKPDSSAFVVEVTSFLNSDNEILNFDANAKRMFRVGGLQGDKSYIESVKSFPMNTEIKTVKTYARSTGTPGQSQPVIPGATGNYTVEINSSLVLLPENPMQPRYYDERVGYFTRQYVDFEKNPQGVKSVRMITRWRLEPRDEDIEKYKRGELVEPKKPIIYYIDPATPKQWVPYLIQGINDWQKAFEKAGFKNAIIGKEAPVDDPEWSLEDARYSAIVYKPSDIPNASGPHVHDPRTGEILESHINWYHNVMLLLRNWYFVQASPSDPRARKTKFDEELMGQLIRFVSSHEVGHTLGLRHNFGSSSATPVEKLRDKKWLEENGHTASIMDYARFNYVAQPEDNVGELGLFPRIGDYDKWAIEWGYKWIPEAKSAEEEIPILNKLTVERLKNKRLWFGRETNPDDPRSQNEDLGDNSMKASAYGIRNLQRIVPNLLEWTREPNENYSSLNTLYNEVVTQFNRYVGHVSKNVAGIMETPKTVEQDGPVYEYVSREQQKEAMDWLNKYVFITPTWILDQKIFEKTGTNGTTVVNRVQDAALSRLLSAGTVTKLLNAEAELGAKAYTLGEMLTDLKKNVFTELSTRKSIDIYRRNLQKNMVERLLTMVKPPAAPTGSTGITISFGPTINKNSDAISYARGTLRAIQSEIRAALPSYTNTASRYHLQDLLDRINDGLTVK
jgi:hypothetical protein